MARARAKLRTRLIVGALIGAVLVVSAVVGALFEFQHRRVEVTPGTLAPPSSTINGGIVAGEESYELIPGGAASDDPTRNPIRFVWRATDKPDQRLSFYVSRNSSSLWTAMSFLLGDPKSEAIEDDGTYGPRGTFGPAFGADDYYVYCQYGYTPPIDDAAPKCASWSALLIYGQYEVSIVLSNEVGEQFSLPEFRSVIGELTSNVSAKLSQ